MSQQVVDCETVPACVARSIWRHAWKRACERVSFEFRTERDLGSLGQTDCFGSSWADRITLNANAIEWLITDNNVSVDRMIRGIMALVHETRHVQQNKVQCPVFIDTDRRLQAAILAMNVLERETSFIAWPKKPYERRSLAELDASCFTYEEMVTVCGAYGLRNQAKMLGFSYNGDHHNVVLTSERDRAWDNEFGYLPDEIRDSFLHTAWRNCALHEQFRKFDGLVEYTKSKADEGKHGCGPEIKILQEAGLCGLYDSCPNTSADKALIFVAASLQHRRWVPAPPLWQHNAIKRSDAGELVWSVDGHDVWQECHEAYECLPELHSMTGAADVEPDANGKQKSKKSKKSKKKQSKKKRGKKQKKRF